MKKFVIGRNEIIDLPSLQLFQVEAKIDTGANTSAIHYSRAEVIERGGKRVLHFNLLDPTHPQFNDKDFYAENFQQREVKNSFGDSEMRYIITTDVKIFDKIWTTELSLSNRGNLKFPILLGRRLLRQGFIVDVTKTKVSFKQKSTQE